MKYPKIPSTSLQCKWNHGKFEQMFAPTADENYIGLVRSLLGDLGMRDSDMKDGPWLAGGTCRRLLEGQLYLGADFDLFFKNEKQKNELRDFIIQQYDPEIMFESENAVTYKVLYYNRIVILQLIHRKYYDMPSDVISDFDIIACQFVTNGEVVVHGTMAPDQVAKRILRVSPSVVNKESFSAVHTLRRMIKMGQDGYRMGQYHVGEFLNHVVKNPKLIKYDTPMSPEYDENGNPCVAIKIPGVPF